MPISTSNELIAQRLQAAAAKAAADVAKAKQAAKDAAKAKAAGTAKTVAELQAADLRVAAADKRAKDAEAAAVKAAADAKKAQAVVAEQKLPSGDENLVIEEKPGGAVLPATPATTPAAQEATPPTEGGPSFLTLGLYAAGAFVLWRIFRK